MPADTNAPLLLAYSNSTEHHYRQYSNQSTRTEMIKHPKFKRQLGGSVNNLFNNFLNINSVQYNFHKFQQKQNENLNNGNSNINKVIDQDNKKRLK